MRIHRLRLSNVKGIADRTVDFPERGVVVIEGPNEVGKTSMLEALDLLLEEKDSSRKRHVLAARPVGRDVGTTIEAELSTGGYRFRYRKQWFRQPATELHVLAPRVEHLTGVTAHDRVVQILAETADLTLWRALRLMQAAPLHQVSLGGSRVLSAALDAAAEGELGVGLVRHGSGPEPVSGHGAAAAADDAAYAEGLLAAAEAEHGRYFTAAKGQPAGEYRAALDAVEAARTAEREAAALVAEVTDDVRRHEACLAEAEHTHAELRAAEGDLAEWESTWAEVSGLLERHGAIERETAAAERERARAVERERERARQCEEVNARREAVDALGGQVGDLRDDLGRDEERLRAVQAERADALRALSCAEALVEVAEGAEAAARRTARIEALRARCARAEEADAQRRSALAALSRLTIDEATVRSLEKASTAVDLAVAQRDADSAHLTIVGLTDGRVVVVDGHEVQLDAGAELARGLAEPLDVEIPGQVTLRFRPETAAGERAADVHRARARLADALREAGVRDVEEARDRWEERRSLHDRFARATERLDDLLGGSSLEQMRDELASVLMESDEGVEDADQPSPGSVVVLHDESAAPRSAQELRADLTQAREAHIDLTARAEALRGAVEEARVEHTRADSLLGAARRELDAAAERLGRARRQETDDALVAAVVAADAEVNRLRQSLSALRDRLEEVDAEGTQALLAAARTRATVCAERVGRLRDERLAIEARLEHSGRQGRYDAWAAARSALQHAERRLVSVARRAEAARLLHQTLQAHRAEATRRYVEPFAAAIHRLGSVVYGPGFAVEMAEDLTVTARVVDGTRIEFDALSTGAKEQLAILTRLAVATLVDAHDGVPVVIDDALGYTDPARLRRMAAAFSRVGDGAQVILLTCTPGRYDGIRGAEVVRMRPDPAERARAEAG